MGSAESCVMCYVCAQGPTVSDVFTLNQERGLAEHHVFATTICVEKKRIYSAVKELQKVGGKCLSASSYSANK